VDGNTSITPVEYNDVTPELLTRVETGSARVYRALSKPIAFRNIIIQSKPPTKTASRILFIVLLPCSESLFVLHARVDYNNCLPFRKHVAV